MMQLHVRTTGSQLALLIGLSGLLAAGHLALRPELPWIAEEPADLGACELTQEDPNAAPDPEAERLATVSASQAIALVGRDAVTFVDARARGRFVDGHIPGALCLPAAEAPTLVAETSLPIDPEGLVLAYCEGSSSTEADELGALLRDRLGCAQVKVIDGGWQQWLADGGPTRRDDDGDGDGDGGREQKQKQDRDPDPDQEPDHG